MMQIALLTESTKVSQTDLAFWAAAIDKQLREHVCPAWGLAVWPVSAFSSLPDDRADLHPMFVLDDLGVPGALGFHDDEAGFIYSRILPPDDPNDATTASHEACEMIVDPTCDQYGPPLGNGLRIARESSDPVEATGYPITVTLDGITRAIMVSNFVLPAYFDPASQGPWDYLGMLSGPAPAQLPGGYLIEMDRDGNTSEVFARFRPESHALAKTLAYKRADPMSRLARRKAAAGQRSRKERHE